MRWVDDYLILSRSPRRLLDCAQIFRQGFPEYGCSINMLKCSSNLPSDLGSKEGLAEDVWIPQSEGKNSGRFREGYDDLSFHPSEGR